MRSALANRQVPTRSKAQGMARNGCSRDPCLFTDSQADRHEERRGFSEDRTCVIACIEAIMRVGLRLRCRVDDAWSTHQGTGVLCIPNRHSILEGVV